MAKRQTTTDDSGGGADTAPAAAPRLSVQLTADGGIAWDRMRDTTREQLRRALSEPDAAARLGVAASTAAAAGADDLGFDPSIAGVMYDALSTLMVGLARRQGYTDEQAAVLRFSQDEKGVLSEPTAKVLNKWVPAGKYQDELMLGVVLTTMIAGKVTMLRRSAQVIHMTRRPDADGSAAVDLPVGFDPPAS